MERKTTRKFLVGIVTSTKMQKTVTVKVETRFKHPLYRKLVIHSKKYHVHDETQETTVGDKVEIMETRPISKTVNWTISRIIERAK